MQPETKYDVIKLPTNEIFLDNSFNCRGPILAHDCVDLSHNIRERGLDQPIVVQPYDKMAGKKWRIVNGHRRFTAMKMLSWLEIPCFVRPDFDEQTARIQNLTENLHRSDLNITQEARSLKWFFDLGLSDQMIAIMLGMYPAWAYARRVLLDLPEDIQAAAATGLLTQEQIKHLSKMKNKDDQYAFVRAVKDRRAKGEKFKIVNNIRSKEEAFRAKERKKAEIEQVVEMLMDVWPDGNLTTRFGAWCSGHIDTFTFMTDIQRAAADDGRSFTIPSEIREGIK